jgi:hypothetical protein
MADSDLIYTVHNVTGLVSEVPRAYLGLYDMRELSEQEVADLYKKAAAPATAKTPAPVDSPTVPEPVKEG